jgi:uncharacterized membrane protein YjfL (UPF0719 family)
MALGPVIPFHLLIIFWIARMVVMSLICSILGWLGIRVLDALTPRIHEREKIGEDPVSVGLFVAGFVILIGLIIHGTCTAPIVIGVSLVRNLIDLQRLLLVTITFFVSLLVGIALFKILNKLTPKIPFLSIRDNSKAVGLYVAGYLVFLGIIMHSALTMSL